MLRQVCIKIIKNNKDFFDQSLDEIKLLKASGQHFQFAHARDTNSSKYAAAPLARARLLGGRGLGYERTASPLPLAS